MIANSVEFLEWDSRFFDYRISKIVLNSEEDGCDDSLCNELDAISCKLAYLFVSSDDVMANKLARSWGAWLADMKTTFEKTTERHDDFCHDISDYSGRKLDENLKKLVLQSGVFSRFRTDSHFVQGEYERLYVEWLRKSLNQTIALKTLVIKSGSIIVGLTTLGSKSDKADIGLVAVDEFHRGQGIGRDLIHYADQDAHAMGFSRIQVVTQMRNKGACRLYEKCGFQMNGITNVYHYWRD